MSEPATFIFAPEIEQALVASMFQVPERLGLIYRELDPAVHITQPHLRHILDAIRLAYTELGSTDFASLIQVLREEDQLTECGGTEGVNSVLEQYRYGFSSPEAAEQIIAHYITMLKTYALNRAWNPPQSVYRFTDGKATLVPNKLTRSQSDPDWIGEAHVRGRSYTARAWMATDGSFLNLRFQPKL